MSTLYYLLYAAAAGGMDPLISAQKNIGGQEMKIKVMVSVHFGHLFMLSWVW
jgi:hypothetical protein